MKKDGNKYREMDDRTAASLAAEGDDRAFSALVSRHQKALKQYIRLFCPNSADAEDICQETFRKAFQSIRSYNPEYQFKTWLYSIGHNSAIDHIRRSENFSTVDLIVDSEETVTDLHKSASSPEEELIGNQAYNSFLKAISDLPERYREIAELRFIQEFSYEDISKKLGLQLNTVRTRIRRARKMIFSRIFTP